MISLRAYNGFLDFPHLAFAARCAISFLFLADNFLALAGPPFNPPLFPISERYFEISDLSFCGSGSSVES